MTNIYFDSRCTDGQRRQHLYAGDVHVVSGEAEGQALIEWTQLLIQEAFGPHDPRQAQHHLDVHEFAAILSALKPRFIHHPRTWELIRDLVRRAGADPYQTYLDVPRLRGATSHGYLTAGAGYAFPMHRDTWWSAPLQQLNWWLPIYPVVAENAMAFHPAYWNTPVANTSGDFDYYDWNVRGRAESSKHVTSDTRVQPKIIQEPPPSPGPSLRLVVPEGSVIVFSGQHMHSTVPNVSGETRFSIDFRTINLADVEAGIAAPNPDSQPRGTSLRDFRRLIDKEAVPEELALRLDPREVPPEVAVYRPPQVIMS